MRCKAWIDNSLRLKTIWHDPCTWGPPGTSKSDSIGKPEVSDAARQGRTAVRQAVLRYLRNHPRASDSVTGISAWWLPEEGVEEDRTMVEEVLEELAAEALVRRFELPDGTVVFASADVVRRDP